MGSPERALFDDESETREEIDPAHFYAAYVFDQPEVHGQDIAAIVRQAKTLGCPTRFWWLSEAMDLEGQTDRLIICIHHASSAADAGIDLYRALKEQQVSWTELEAAAAAEYLLLGRPLDAIEEVQIPEGIVLFPQEQPAMIEPVQPQEELAIRIEVSDPVMETLTPEAQESLRQALSSVDLLFQSVLAQAKTRELSGEALEQTLGFLAELFTSIAQLDDNALWRLQAAIQQEVPFMKPDQKANPPSPSAALVAGTQLDEAEAIVEAAFAAWMGKVDEVVQDMAGCSLHDLPDIDYRGFFEIGINPYEAADTALLEAGWFS